MKKRSLLTCALGALLISTPVKSEMFRLIASGQINNSNNANISNLISSEASHSGITILNIEAANLTQALTIARTSGQYELIEEDIAVTSIKIPPPTRYAKAPWSIDRAERRPNNDNIPTDPEFAEQWYWQKATTEYKGHNNVLSAYQSSVYKRKPRVGIVDSGFYENDDFVYSADSYSLTSEFEEVRGNYFYGIEDQELCQFAHGTSIAAIIGGTQNNNVGIAGIVEADLIAVRAMKCGIGSLSDVADAVYYMAGKAGIADAPVISEKVDVINLSLGGPSDKCPQYMQNAIDYAVTNNIAVTVAAGNDQDEVKNYSPANCQNVIVVGAVNRAGEKAPFSNTGLKVDLVAAGMDVAAPGPNGDIYWWEGTSQAAPIVTAMIALAKAEHPDISPSEIEALLTLTTSEYSTTPTSEKNSCDNHACGTGVLDSGNFLTTLRSYRNGDLSYIKHALSDKDSCTKELYTDYFDKTLKLCDMYKVTFMANRVLDETVEYELFRIPVDQAFTISNATSLLTTNEPSLMSSELDTDNYNYGYTVCSNDKCSEGLLWLDLTQAQKPESCQTL